MSETRSWGHIDATQKYWLHSEETESLEFNRGPKLGPFLCISIQHFAALQTCTLRLGTFEMGRRKTEKELRGLEGERPFCSTQENSGSQNQNGECANLLLCFRQVVTHPPLKFSFFVSLSHQPPRGQLYGKHCRSQKQSYNFLLKSMASFIWI